MHSEISNENVGWIFTKFGSGGIKAKSVEKH